MAGFEQIPSPSVGVPANYGNIAPSVSLGGPGAVHPNFGIVISFAPVGYLEINVFLGMLFRPEFS